MFQTLRNAWQIKDLRKKILYTLFMIVIFRLGSVIPVPLVNSQALADLAQGGGLFGLLDQFSGGAFSQATIFAMSITPYVNSSIIMQLLTVAIPALERLSKEGEEGRKKIASWTRYLTVVLAFIQATGLYFGIKGIVTTGHSFVAFVVITLTFTAGTAFLMWLGEQITEKGIGNGISVIIFAGIVARMPVTVRALYENFIAAGFTTVGIIKLVAIIIVAALSIVFVVFVTDAERRIPVQYAKRMVGRKMYGGQSTHIPIKVAMAGVIPIIFASSLMQFPIVISTLVGYEGTGVWRHILSGLNQENWCKPDQLVYSIGLFVYIVLTIFFAYFYTSLTFNPLEIANNMKKQGGFIPGIRPGKPTSDYLAKVLNSIIFIGAVGLIIIAVIPFFFNGVFGASVSFGGTSLIIIVSVVLETMKQIESQMLVRNYKGFLND